MRAWKRASATPSAGGITDALPDTALWPICRPLIPEMRGTAGRALLGGAQPRDQIFDGHALAVVRVKITGGDDAIRADNEGRGDR